MEETWFDHCTNLFLKSQFTLGREMTKMKGTVFIWLSLNQTHSRLTLKYSALTIFVIRQENSTEVLRFLYFNAARDNTAEYPPHIGGRSSIFLKDSMNIDNKTGARIEPCGTPQASVCEDELRWPIETLKLLFVQKDSNLFNTKPKSLKYRLQHSQLINWTFTSMVWNDYWFPMKLSATELQWS